MYNLFCTSIAFGAIDVYAHIILYAILISIIFIWNNNIFNRENSLNAKQGKVPCKFISSVVLISIDQKNVQNNLLMEKYHIKYSTQRLERFGKYCIEIITHDAEFE